MGDEQHGAVEAQQGFFQPGDGADVQVVGRLVEQQQVGLGHQGLGQQHAATPAAGQLGEGLVRRQLQAAQGAVHQLLQAPAIASLEFLLDAGQLGQVGIGLDVLAEMVELGQQRADLRQPFGHHVEHGAIVGARQFLRQFADLQRRRTPDLAVVGELVALDQAQQAGLAGAVAADDAHPLAAGDLPGHLIQQRHGAVGEGYVGELEQRHGGPPGSGRAFYPVCRAASRAFFTAGFAGWRNAFTALG
ncbi:hypothetical protein D9M70_264550 [compost metagenome]